MTSAYDKNRWLIDTHAKTRTPGSSFLYLWISEHRLPQRRTLVDGHRATSVVIAVAALTLLAAGCSSDTAEQAAPASTAVDAPTTVAGAPADTAAVPVEGSTTTSGAADESAHGDLSLVPAGETDLLGNPAGQGFVILSGVRYDFILNGGCQKIFGGLQTAGPMADGSDGNVHSIIPPENWETDTAAGWEPPSVDIDIGDDSWRAQAGSEHNAGGDAIEVTPAQSSVTSFTNDGSLVKGEANFYSLFNYDEVETATGTFEFFCP
jgi:hypothetical protein